MRERAGRRRRWLLLLLAVGLLGAYGGLLVLYAVSGHTIGIGANATAPPGGVLVIVKLEELHGESDRLTVSIDIAPDKALAGASGFVPKDALTIVIDPSTGARQIVLPAGQIPPLTRVDLQLEGDIRTWPLDKYRVDALVGVFAGEPDAGDDLPIAVQVGGDVEGWRIDVGAAEPLSEELDFVVFPIDARRAGNTLAFAFILLAIMVALPVIALIVAVNTRWRSCRTVQPTFMSWLAAMLFATVPLRNFLPGSPPPGSWIDAVVVLWVIAGLVVALAIYASAWYRQTAS